MALIVDFPACDWRLVLNAEHIIFAHPLITLGWNIALASSCLIYQQVEVIKIS